jgi:Fe-Mn family superoxide dismutase
MQIHHGKHHQAYVNNLNAAVEKAPELASWDIDKLCRDIAKVPESVRGAVRNNGGGHWNHAFFWQGMVPASGGEPTDALAAAITSAFGDFAKFRDQFKAAATGRFGSGWAWLVAAKDGTVSVMSTPNQDNPLMEGKHAVLGLDVWEHAYYLNYQNRRPDYVDAFWYVVHWGEALKRYETR